MSKEEVIISLKLTSAEKNLIIIELNEVLHQRYDQPWGGSTHAALEKVYSSLTKGLSLSEIRQILESGEVDNG